MKRIVTYAHRYKRPPKKRPPVVLKVPTVVRKRASTLWQELLRRATGKARS